MKKVLLLLFVAAVVLVTLVPLPATAASGDEVASSQAAENAQGGSAGVPVNGVDVSFGLPKVTEQDALDKAARITGKIHRMASQIMPELTLVILVVGAVLGIFWGEARRMVLFAIIALVVVLWAPFLISLAISLLNA